MPFLLLYHTCYLRQALDSNKAMIKMFHKYPRVWMFLCLRTYSRTAVILETENTCLSKQSPWVESKEGLCMSVTEQIRGLYKLHS